MTDPKPPSLVQPRPGDPPITPELVLRLGYAAGRVFAAMPPLAASCAFRS